MTVDAHGLWHDHDAPDVMGRVGCGACCERLDAHVWRKTIVDGLVIDIRCSVCNLRPIDTLGLYTVAVA